jgi:hypothetical protein
VQNFYQDGERPAFGKSQFDPAMEAEVQELIRACWHQEPERRPSFDSIFETLERMRFRLFRDVDVKAISRYVESVLAYEKAHR